MKSLVNFESSLDAMALASSFNDRPFLTECISILVRYRQIDIFSSFSPLFVFTDLLCCCSNAVDPGKFERIMRLLKASKSLRVDKVSYRPLASFFASLGDEVVSEVNRLVVEKSARGFLVNPFVICYRCLY